MIERKTTKLMITNKFLRLPVAFLLRTAVDKSAFSSMVSSIAESELFVLVKGESFGFVAVDVGGRKIFRNFRIIIIRNQIDENENMTGRSINDQDENNENDDLRRTVPATGSMMKSEQREEKEKKNVPFSVSRFFFLPYK